MYKIFYIKHWAWESRQLDGSKIVHNKVTNELDNTLKTLFGHVQNQYKTISTAFRKFWQNMDSSLHVSKKRTAKTVNYKKRMYSKEGKNTFIKKTMLLYFWICKASGQIKPISCFMHL